MERLRHVTKYRAVFYFTTDETNETVRVLGVFFGGQDHRRHLLARIASEQLWDAKHSVAAFDAAGP